MAAMTAQSSGECNYPLQPAFLAGLTTTLTAVTGDATAYTVVFDTEVFDQNGDFNGTTTFTAPVGGRYSFRSGITAINSAAANAHGYVTLVTSNRSYFSKLVNVWNETLATTRPLGLLNCVLADMDAGDTAVLRITIGGVAKNINLTGSGAFRNFFSGSLIC